MHGEAETHPRRETRASPVDEAGQRGRRPRLLFVAPWFLFPRVSGGRIRTTDVLRGMKGGAFDITLASPRTANAGDWKVEVDATCDRFVSWPDTAARPALQRARTLASPLPASVALDRTRIARQCVADELASRPDVVVFDFVHTTILAPEQSPPTPSVVFAHNVEHEIFERNAAAARGPLRRALWRSQSAKMKRFERRALARVDRVIAVSERDAALLRDRLALENVSIVPTGVDVDFYSYAEQPDRGDLTSCGGTVVFTGLLNWLPNIDGLEWFMDEVWPKITAVSPRTQLVVVGPEPPRHLVTEAARRGLAWTFTGFVDDVRPLVRAADISVIPLRTGGGTRIKAYEAMALGRPVVATTVGVEGLPLTTGEHYLRADSTTDFAAAVLRLLRNAALRRQLAAAARAYVERFSLRLVGRAFEEICLAVARTGGESAARSIAARARHKEEGAS